MNEQNNIDLAFAGLHSGSETERLSAVKSIAESDDARAADALRSVFNDEHEDEFVRREAIFGFERAGLASPLIACVADPAFNSMLKCESLLVLRRMHSPEAADAFFEAISNGNRSVRAEAKRSLLALGDAASASAKRHSDSPDRRVRRVALRILGDSEA